ncbi:MAG: LysR family transcriptional regulator [Pseudomonadota bacterium]
MADLRQISPGLIRSLEVLVAVAETGQMRAGARLLGLTQPSASQHIAALEKAFGERLLDRSTRPARLTHAGLRLNQQAQNVLAAMNMLETEMRRGGRSPIGILRIGLQASIATTLTPDLVALTQEKYDVRDLTLHAGQSGDHERLLRTKRADLAITSNPFLDLDGLERHPVITEAYLLVLPRDYDGPCDDLDAVQQRLPLVRFSDTTNAGRQIAQHLRRLRFEPGRVIQADRSSMVTSCVAQGMGFSLLTPTLLIDGLVEQMPMRILPLPVRGLSRTLTVVARMGELHDLPQDLATRSAAILRAKIGEVIGAVGTSALRTAGQA